MTALHLRTTSRGETIALGRLIGASLPPGTIVCLDGDLGAGKTALTVGLAQGVECRGAVSSPTFTLLIEHEAGERGLPLYHFDVYRLPDGDAFLGLGFDEYLGGSGVCVIEWSSRIRDVLPDGCLSIELCLGSSGQPDERRLAIAWPGHEDWLDALSSQWTANGDPAGSAASAEREEGPLC